MKKLFYISVALLISCTTDYTSCPESPYNAHDFYPTILHETYQWAECKNCGLTIRESYESDFISIEDPKTKK